MREIAASSDSVQQRVAEMSVTARVLRAASERAVIGGADDAPVVERSAGRAPATATQTRASWHWPQRKQGRSPPSRRATRPLEEASHRIFESGRRIEEMAGYIGALAARFTVDEASPDHRNARASASEIDSAVAVVAPYDQRTAVASESAEHSNESVLSVSLNAIAASGQPAAVSHSRATAGRVVEQRK